MIIMKQTLINFGIAGFLSALVVTVFMLKSSDAEVEKLASLVAQQQKTLTEQSQAISQLSEQFLAFDLRQSAEREQSNTLSGQFTDDSEEQQAALAEKFGRLIKVVSSQSRRLNELQEMVSEQEQVTPDSLDITNGAANQISVADEMDQLAIQSQKKITTLHNEVQDQFDSESIDDNWANDLQVGIQSSLDVLIPELGGRSDSVQAIECKSSMCKVVMHIGNQSVDVEMLKMELSAGLADTFRRSTTVVNPGYAGESQRTYYFWN